jgi:hypothetical protein
VEPDLSHCLFVGGLHRRNEPVSQARKGFDEFGCLGSIAERIAQFAHTVVQDLFKIQEGIVGPNALLERLARDQFAGMLQKNGKYLNRVTAHFHLGAIAVEFVRAQVEIELLKSN